jgi:hypothetical protein
MVARITAVPGEVAWNELPTIVAPVVPALCTLQTIVLCVAFAGATVDVRVRAVPAVAVVGTPVIAVTGTCVPEVIVPIVIVIVLTLLSASHTPITAVLVLAFGVVGVPEMTPAELMDMPSGRLCAKNEYGALPPEAPPLTFMFITEAVVELGMLNEEWWVKVKPPAVAATAP